nr:Gag-Pol polyprotein [Tanacetum cinerariifolium]
TNGACLLLGKVEEGRANAMEVVEWAGMEERWGKNVWREKRNDLVAGLLKFKYHKEHLCPSCEQGKSKRASHQPKPVPNSRQRLHLLHMDLCGPMRIASINGKRYILVIVDDYSRYTWVHFLRSKDEAPDVIITFLKRITVLLQSPVIIIRTDNGTEFKN